MGQHFMLWAGFGAVAGAINAAVTNDASSWPRFLRLGTPRRLIVRMGLLGNLAVGAAAAVAVSWAITIGPSDTLLTALIDCAIGFMATRVITNEGDKALLRAAVLKAAAAPAADPETVGRLEHATPLTMFTIAEGLMPWHS